MFVLQERIRTVYDPETRTEVSLERAGPGTEYYDAVCSSPELGRFVFFVSLESKYRDSHASDMPTIKIHSRNLDSAFRKKNMLDSDYNSHLVRYLVSGVVEISRDYPLTRSPIIYSDYEEEVACGREFVYCMPSDEDLLQMSKRILRSP